MRGREAAGGGHELVAGARKIGVCAVVGFFVPGIGLNSVARVGGRAVAALRGRGSVPKRRVGLGSSSRGDAPVTVCPRVRGGLRPRL